MAACTACTGPLLSECTAATCADGYAAGSFARGAGSCTQQIVDCAGSWSACTAACEAASLREWRQSVAQSGEGAACPPASACQPGEGLCREAGADNGTDSGASTGADTGADAGADAGADRDPCSGCSCSVAPALPPPVRLGCEEGYYNSSTQVLRCFEAEFQPEEDPARSTVAAGGACQPCPRCAECAGGRVPPLLRRDWAEPVIVGRGGDSRFAFKCDPLKGCLGARKDSAGCDEGHAGALCQSCEEGYFLDAIYDCVACDGNGTFRSVIVFIVMLLVVAALMLAAAAYRWKPRGWSLVPGMVDSEESSQQPAEVLATVQWFGRTVCVRLVARAAIQPVRIVFSHFQLVTLLTAVLSTNWPDSLLAQLGKVRQLVQFYRLVTQCGDVDDFTKTWLARVVVWPGKYASNHSCINQAPEWLGPIKRRNVF